MGEIFVIGGLGWEVGQEGDRAWDYIGFRV